MRLHLHCPQPRKLIIGASAILGGFALLSGASLPAAADTSPPAGVPATVSADALPTVQVDGVVWSQATAGNTVYAAGSFANARPAGAAPQTQLIPRHNLLAYDITTGQLIAGFNHFLNAQAVVATTSPDGSTLYVGGDFTKVDGQPRPGIAAFNTATGALLSTFAPSFNGRVRAIAAGSSTVYVGGSFTTADGTSRPGLASFSAANGSLLAWNPTAGNGFVSALVLAPSGKTLVVGGSFSTLAHVTALGLGAVNPITGAGLPWAANASIHDYGSGGAIDALRTDGSQVYGSGYAFGSGNFEGAFAANPDTGVINAMEDCHGDTYDVLPVGQVMYVVSHEHYCANIGAFPDNSPWTWYRSTAFTTYKTGIIAHNASHTNVHYHDWYGNPAMSQLVWYPYLLPGSYTGQNQAAWSLTGNANYIALGGEFPSVNKQAQQGLVRFAVRAVAPNKVGPWSGTTPTATSPSHQTVVVSWLTAWDQDNQALTYQVIRDGHKTPVYTVTANSTFWQRPTLTFTDSNLPSGIAHSYRVNVYDPLGNMVAGGAASVTVS